MLYIAFSPVFSYYLRNNFLDFGVCRGFYVAAYRTEKVLDLFFVATIAADIPLLASSVYDVGYKIIHAVTIMRAVR